MNNTTAILHDPDNLSDRCLQLIKAKCQAAGLMLRLRLATEARNRQPERQTPSNNGLPPGGQAFQSDQSLAPFPLLDPVAYFATDSIPPRVPDRAPVPPPDAPYDAPLQPELENKKSVDQLNRPVRQAFQSDTASPQATTKFESAQSVDQLAAEARRPKSENPPFVDQLNRPVPSGSSSPKAPGKLENQEVVDQLLCPVRPLSIEEREEE